MTIREHITRRFRLLNGTAFGLWLLFASTLILGQKRVSPALSVVGHPTITFICFAGFFAAVVAVMTLVRCPRCNESLGRTMASQRLNFCPRCGTSFDEPM